MILRLTSFAALLCLALPASATPSASGPAIIAVAQSSSSGVRAATPSPGFQSDRIQVTVEGEGPDLILIPGMNSSPEIWDTTVDHIGQGRKIHRVHVRGFAGLAPGGNAEGPVLQPVADEISRYLREGGLNRPAIVGHSMGGSLALIVAAAGGDQVSRVMVVDMAPFMGASISSAPGGVEAIADQIMAASTAMSDEAWAEQGRTSAMAMVLNEAVEPSLVQHALTSDRAVSARVFRDLLVTDLRPRLTQITAPVTVLYVKLDDPRITEAMTDRIYSDGYGGLTSVTLQRIPDAAHFLMFDQPEAYFTALDAFLETP